jgi:hypothetical protein
MNMAGSSLQSAPNRYSKRGLAGSADCGSAKIVSVSSAFVLAIAASAWLIEP